jgi:hypothetical protein
MVLLVGFTVQPQVAEAQQPKQVYAFYMGWWRGDSWNSDLLSDKPLELYDSQDGNALGRHIDQAKGAGIDAFVMSWFGPKNGNLTSNVFNMLLDQASARGFMVGAVVDMFQSDYNENVDVVLESLRYLIGDRINHPAYLRYNGKPVIYFWNQRRFSLADWQNIRAQVDPDHNTIWVAEGTSTGYLPTFDGLYLFNTAWARNPAATAQQWMNNTMNAGGSFYTPTVLPGWDESLVAARENRPNPTTKRDRANGDFLTRSWNGAVSTGANVILVVSWNEYFENSHIEPSQVYGTQALDMLRNLIGNWKGGGGGSAPAAPAPTGTVVMPNTIVNVRAGAGTNFDKLGKIQPGEFYTLTGEVEGWYIIDYHGQQGFVSKNYSRVEQH